MDNLTRRTLALWPDAPTTPTEALRHTLAICADLPDGDMAAMATSGIYGPGTRTGLTWGDLRALAAQLDGTRDAAIAEAAEAVLSTRGPLVHQDSTYAAYDAVRRLADPNAPSIQDEADED